jgi:hypothetical protein
MKMNDYVKYLGKFFLKLDAVQDGPIQRTIVGGEDGAYDHYEIVFDTGERLSLNRTNFRALYVDYGPPENWPGKLIELYEGPLLYQGKAQPGLRVRPLDPRTRRDPPPPRKPGDNSDLDDSIGF